MKLPYQVTIELPIDIDSDVDWQIYERSMFCDTHFARPDWTCSRMAKMERIAIETDGDVRAYNNVVRRHQIYAFRHVVDAIYFKLRFG